MRKSALVVWLLVAACTKSSEEKSDHSPRMAENRNPISSAVIPYYGLLYPSLSGKEAPKHLLTSSGPRYIFYHDGFLLFCPNRGNLTQWHCFDIENQRFISVPESYNILTTRMIDRKSNRFAIPNGDESKGPDAWGWGTTTHKSNRFTWEWDGEKHEAIVTRNPFYGTYLTYPYAFYRDYFLISRRSDMDGWRLAGMQAYDIDSGSLLWERVPKRYSGAWAFKDDTLLNVSSGGCNSRIERIDLKTGKQMWELALAEQKESTYQYDPVKDLPPNLGSGRVQSQVTDDGWVIASDRGVLIAVTFDGKLKWARKYRVGFNRKFNQTIHPPLGGYYPSSRMITAYKRKIFVLDELGRILHIDSVSGKILNVYSVLGKIVSVPVFYRGKAVLFTPVAIHILDPSDLESVGTTSDDDAPPPPGFSLSLIPSGKGPIIDNVELLLRLYNNTAHPLWSSPKFEFWARKDKKEYLLKVIKHPWAVQYAYSNRSIDSVMPPPPERGVWEFFVRMQSAVENSHEGIRKRKMLKLGAGDPKDKHTDRYFTGKLDSNVITLEVEPPSKDELRRKWRVYCPESYLFTKTKKQK